MKIVPLGEDNLLFGYECLGNVNILIRNSSGHYTYAGDAKEAYISTNDQGINEVCYESCRGENNDTQTLSEGSVHLE